MKGNTRSKYLSPLPTWFPVEVHERQSKNSKNCLSINFASWKRWHPISGRIQPRPHALSQSYRFLIVSLSWSQGAGLKRASGQRTGTWDDQDGSLSQNHHRCHGDLILKDCVIIMILSAPRDSTPPLGEKCGQVSVQQEEVFSTGIHRYKNRKSKKQMCTSWCHSQLEGQVLYPDSEQVLVMRKKSEALKQRLWCGKIHIQCHKYSHKH